MQIALLLFPLGMIAAATCDVMTLRIPNWLTAALAAAFLPAAAGAGMPVILAMQGVAAGFGLLALGLLLFGLRLVGGGDAKLMAVAALWLGLENTLNFLFLTALAGAFLAVAVGLLQFTRVELSLKTGRMSGLFEAFKADVPYGYAICAGAILTMPGTWWMNATAG